VIGIDARLAGLTARLNAAYRDIGAMTAESRSLGIRRQQLVNRINASLVHPAGAPASTGPASATPPEEGAPDQVRAPGAGGAGAPDASPRTVQNLLFVVGALLLGVGAIVFTAVAWQTYGVTGRAVILGTATTVALAVPLLALRRRLVATAETFAVIALLLLGLDGVALWSVDLFGVRTLPAGRYAAVVLAVVTAVAAGYAVPTRLVGPRFAALVAAQPVLPLAVLTSLTPIAGTAAALSGVALGNLFVLAVTRRRPMVPAQQARIVFEVAPIVLAGASLAVGTSMALVSLLLPGHGALFAAVGAVAACAVVLAVAGRVATPPDLRAAAIAGSTVEFALIGARVVSHVRPGEGPLAAAVVTVVVAGVAAAVPGRLWFARGLRLGAWIVVGAAGARIGLTVLAVSLERIARVAPLWHTDLATLTSRPGLAEPWVPIAVVAAGLSVVLLRRGQGVVTVAAVTAAVLPVAVPASVDVVWWSGPALDATALLPLVAVAVTALRRGERVGLAALAGVLALALGVHAAWMALARPFTTAATLGGLTLLGSALVLLVTPAAGRPVRAVVAGTGLGTAMVAFPGAVAATFASDPHGTVAPLRAVLAAVVAGLAVPPLLRRHRPELLWYAIVSLWTTAIAAAVAPVVVPTSERPALYALTALVVSLAAPLLAGVRGRAAAGTAVPATVLSVAALPAVLTIAAALLVSPYGDLARAWSGVPSGTGVPNPPDPLDVAAMLLVTAACVLAGLLAGGRSAILRVATAPAALVVLVALAAAGAPWPAVPAVSVLLGGAAMTWWALALDGGAGRVVAVSGLALLGAGAAGLVPTRTGSLCALGALLVTAAACAVAGRTEPRRVGGWLAAAASAGSLAVVAPRAAGATPGAAAVALTAVAAAAVLGGATLRRRGPAATTEATALEAAGHAAAVVALAISASLAEAAALASAWGAVTGVRALWPARTRRVRYAYVGAGAALQVLAWWLLAAGIGVHTVDAYTAPLAVAALAAGWFAARADPTVRSWVAYAPGLLAGFVPATFPLLTGADVTRRAALGLAALLVLVAGATRRLHAPAVIGGATLSLVAVHELVLLWQFLPTWAPLTAGGLLLLALAVTYERRRRDWRRLRAAVSRMT